MTGIGRIESWAEQAAEVGGDAARAIDLATALGDSAPRPGEGDTTVLFELLISHGRADLTAARVVEAHLDARAILAEAGLDPRAGAWGVFAAEGVRVRSGEWMALGLSAVPSGADFQSVGASPLGEDDWYLERPGFAWGGIGVATCWLGGAEGLARRMWQAARGQSREPDQIALMHLSAVDAQLFAARTLLMDAGRRIDDGHATGAAGKLLAARTRTTVATVVEDVLQRAAHSFGSAPLALEAEHARRVADLELYVRQHHAERDDAALGRRILEGSARGELRPPRRGNPELGVAGGTPVAAAHAVPRARRRDTRRGRGGTPRRRIARGRMAHGRGTRRRHPCRRDHRHPRRAVASAISDLVAERAGGGATPRGRAGDRTAGSRRPGAVARPT